MTDSDPKLPDPAGAGTPPPLDPPGPSAGAMPPIVEASPTGGNPVEPGADLGSLAAGGMEPTTQMPATDVPTDAAGGVPPLGPDGTELDGDDEVPWYKKPAGIAAIAILALAVVGLIAWLIWGGGDDTDDEATPTSSRLIIETTNDIGGVIDVGFAVAVDGPAGAEKAFIWLRPEGVAPGDVAGDNTGDNGRVDFEWEADSTVADPATWNSTATAIAQIPPGWTPPGPTINCARQPLEGPDTTVVMNIEVDSTDESIARVGTATFPNYQFAPGDSVVCRLAAGAPAPTTVVDTTTPETTVVDTTVVDTTVAETTVPETTAPETTAAPTTAAPTTVPTVPPVIIPPAEGETAMDVIDNNPELSGLKALVDAADPSVRELLANPDATITLFAPSNAAIEAADIDLTDEAAVTALLLAHVDGTEALTGAEVFDGRTSIDVLEGGPQPVDAANFTVGGAEVLVAEITPVNGVIHVINAVLSIQP